MQEVSRTSGESNERGFPHHKVNPGLRATWHPFTGEILYHREGGILSLIRTIHESRAVLLYRDRSSPRTCPRLQLVEYPTWLDHLATTGR